MLGEDGRYTSSSSVVIAMDVGPYGGAPTAGQNGDARWSIPLRIRIATPAGPHEARALLEDRSMKIPLPARTMAST